MNMTKTYSLFYLVANYIVEIDEINIIKSFITTLQIFCYYLMLMCKIQIQ